MLTPVIMENITCSVSITRVGSPSNQFTISLDFGNGVVQNFTVQNTATAVFQTQYQTGGNYSVVFRVPQANQQWTLHQLQITGI